MGIFNFLFGGNIDIIEWLEDRNDIVLWKFPDKERDIKYGAQLIVMESQMAILVDQGQIADVFFPGRHELHTENLPLLTALKHWEYGFESPFKADVYFVSSKTFTDLKWGTSQPIYMHDSRLGDIRVSAFGVYFIKITDPSLFFSEFSGTSPTLMLEDIESRLRGLVAPAFGECIAQANIPLSRLSGHFDELGEELRPVIQEKIKPFGIEITHFQISSVSLPPEITAALDANTAQNIRGGNLAEPEDTSPLEILEKLAGLKEKGLLSEEEFETKKKELLSRL